MSNNFILTFGKQPYNLINRIDSKKQIIDSFSNEYPIDQVFFITGVRGSGKTVLLTSISDYFNEQKDWVVVDLNPNMDLLEDLVAKLYLNSKLHSLFSKKEYGFSFHGVSINIDFDTPTLTAECWIDKIMEKLSKDGKKVLITIDEACNTESMRIFAHTFQSLLRKNRLVFLLMTGLYENISEIQNNKTSTFLLRAQKIFVTSLNLSSISTSYKNIFNITSKEAATLAKITCGYAFAYQLLGYLLQKNNLQIPNKKVIGEYDEYLSQYVYEKIWSDLTKAEKELLIKFGTDDEIQVKELIKKTNKTSSYISLYRDRLLKKGIIMSPSYGYLAFALPRFNEFIESMSYDEDIINL